MRTYNEINHRNRLIKALNKANYSENSIGVIVNTYFLTGIQKHWDKETKKIIKDTERGEV